MTIPEAQLQTWCKQGATGSSRDTYAAVRRVLEDTTSPFAGKNPTVFLQGSYSNDTNVARDSDVDVVAFIAGTFAHDANTLAEAQYQAFESAYPAPASYSYQNYKADVAKWLVHKFGNSVRVGRKAIFIPGNSNRRDCDVLPAIEYRYYYRFNSSTDQSYAQGIAFYLPDGTQIVNFPIQHSDNCSAKHQATDSWFKPTVRIYKNIRNYLVDNGRLGDGVAPSYFIEGLLSNVPNERFGKTFQETVVAALTFVGSVDRSTFKCANGIHMLLGNSHVSWPATNCQAYLTAVSRLWDSWR